MIQGRFFFSQEVATARGATYSYQRSFNNDLIQIQQRHIVHENGNVGNDDKVKGMKVRGLG